MALSLGRINLGEGVINLYRTGFCKTLEEKHFELDLGKWEDLQNASTL